MFVFFIAARIYPNITFTDKVLPEQDIFNANLLDLFYETKNSILSSWNYVDKRPGWLVKNKKLALGFVTPWNPHGYDLALEFGQKFTHFIPAWLKLESTEEGLTFKGVDFVNKTWIKDMRKKHPKIKLLLRIALSADSRFYQTVHRTIRKFIQNDWKEIQKDIDYDGMFFDFTPILVNFRTIDYVPELIDDFKKASGKRKFQSILAMPSISRFDFPLPKKIFNKVDYINMATYDYNSPTEHIQSHTEFDKTMEFFRQTDLKKKAIMGIPFYGLKYIGKSKKLITGYEAIRILSQESSTYLPSATQDDSTIFFKSKSEVGKAHFMSLKDVGLRVRAIKNFNLAGISFWELGQSIPYHFNII